MTGRYPHGLSAYAAFSREYRPIEGTQSETPHRRNRGDRKPSYPAKIHCSVLHERVRIHQHQIDDMPPSIRLVEVVDPVDFLYVVLEALTPRSRECGREELDVRLI